MSELEQEVKAVEAKAEAVVSEVKAEVVKVDEEVKTEVIKVAEEVKAEVKRVAQKLTQELTAEEKLSIRDIEVPYLKAQMEINRLAQTTQKAQEDFTRLVKGLAQKYVLNEAEWLFDNVGMLFKKK